MVAEPRAVAAPPKLEPEAPQRDDTRVVLDDFNSDLNLSIFNDGCVLISAVRARVYRESVKMCYEWTWRDGLVCVRSFLHLELRSESSAVLTEVTCSAQLRCGNAEPTDGLFVLLGRRQSHVRGLARQGRANLPHFRTCPKDVDLL